MITKSPPPVPIQSSPVLQYQMPAFPIRREPSMTCSSASKIFHRPNSFALMPTESCIRKNSHIEQELSVDTTNRWNEPVTMCDNTKIYFSPSQNEVVQDEMYLPESLDINLSCLSNQCLIDYPQPSLNNLIEKESLSSRTRSSSSLEDLDDGQESSSSGIYTDERADLHDDHRTASKDTLSTLEVLSIESIIDSQSSLENCSTRPKIHHYRLPIPTEQIRQTPSPITREINTPLRRQRAHSAEGLLKSSRVQTPTIPKSRQSSAAIAKKIEKRVPTSRSPSATLEKAGFKRVANDTYRLVGEKNAHMYRRHRPNSIIQCNDHDDSLGPAHDEESYAQLPRASSTEQLNNDLQQNLQAIVNDCIRPIINERNSYISYSNKHHSRSKRSNGQKCLRIDEITNKLRSSIDYSIYTQYQRCYS